MGLHLNAFSIPTFMWATGSSNEAGLAGVYGTQGTADPANLPGGRLSAASGAYEAGGAENLWLFGGYGADSSGNYNLLNDLWEYDTASHQWTWVSGSNSGGEMGTYGTKGVDSSSNMPGSRYFQLGWNDSSGNFWIFGGVGFDSASFGYLNDLWKYDVTTHHWVWMTGASSNSEAGIYGTKGIASASSTPGARMSSVSAADSAGHIWVFGGEGVDGFGNQGSLNDLWEYDIATNQWTWVSGSEGINQIGVYGTLGTPSTSNVPSARTNAHEWIDASGNIWIFGGYGFDANGAIGNLNDLWKYNPSDSTWTWMSGSSKAYAEGVYGSKGIASPSNVPGSRQSANFWTDSTGSFWMSGGYGAAAERGGSLNDLWKYDPIAGNWTWYAGETEPEASGVWGTQGISSASNITSSRYYSTSFKTASGNSFWMFGGLGYAFDGQVSALNDLWNITY